MTFRFGAYTFDTERRELSRDGTALPLGPKVFQVLVHLLTHRNCAVAKAELLDACWPDEYVTESALTRRIRLIRQAVEGRS